MINVITTLHNISLDNYHLIFEYLDAPYFSANENLLGILNLRLVSKNFYNLIYSYLEKQVYY